MVSPVDYIKQQNVKEHGEAEEPEKKVEEPDKKVEKLDDEPDEQRSSRSTRRLLRRLGEAEGKAKAYEVLINRGVIPGNTTQEPVIDPEPQRKDFASDVEHNRALGRWDARQEAKKVAGETVTSKEQQKEWQDHIKEMDQKAATDKKFFDDWDAVAEQSAEDGIEWDSNEHQTLMGLILNSDVKASVLYHLAKHQDDLQSFLDLVNDSNALIRKFHRLEGRLEDDLTARQKKIKGEKEEGKNLTLVERDAKKAKPSEAAAVRGGTAPSGTVKPFLEDGKTINPAWMAERNAREVRH